MSGIKIEEFKESDLHLISKWRSNPEVNRFIRPGMRTLNEVRAWYRDYFLKEENNLYSILYDKNVIGYFTIEGIDKTNMKCEFGIVIGEAGLHNKGLGLSAINIMLNRSFDEMGMHRVLAVINEDNIPSVKCFTKAGFVLEGKHREARFLNNGYKDVLLFSILEQEWRTRTASGRSDGIDS